MDLIEFDGDFFVWQVVVHLADVEGASEENLKSILVKIT